MGEAIFFHQIPFVATGYDRADVAWGLCEIISEPSLCCDPLTTEESIQQRPRLHMVRDGPNPFGSKEVRNHSGLTKTGFALRSSTGEILAEARMLAKLRAAEEFDELLRRAEPYAEGPTCPSGWWYLVRSSTAGASVPAFGPWLAP